MLTILRAVRFPITGDFGRQRPVVCGHAEIGGSLEHEKVGRLPRDVWDALDSGRARSDHTDCPARKVDALCRPVSGMVRLALKCIYAWVVRNLRGGKATGCHDAEPYLHPVAAIGFDNPVLTDFVEDRSCHPGSKLNVPFEIETVGYVIQVSFDFGLTGVSLCPLPFLLHLFRERIGVLQAFHIAARAGIPVPKPGTAHAAACLVHLCREAQLT